MKRLCWLTAALVLVGAGPCGAAQDGARSILLRVLYVGQKDTPRARAFAKFLDEAFILVDCVDVRSFDPESAAQADVVVLDWSRADLPADVAASPTLSERDVRSPLGDRASWSKPTVLLGEAGRLLAVSWKLLGQTGYALSPYAYDLRDHPIFRRPIDIEPGKLTRMSWPAEWTERHDEKEEIGVLPLIRKGRKPSRSGWCTASRDLGENPEVEVFSGGLNARTMEGAALWRQGNLLHFGFDLAPDEMSTAGKELLINAIGYISHFAGDRPILEHPVLVSGKPVLSSTTIVQVITRNLGLEWESLKTYFDPELLAAAGVVNMKTFARWYPSVRGFLSVNDEGLMAVDADAEKLYLKPGRPDFFPRAIARLAHRGEEAQCARRLLLRHAPQAPRPEAPGWEWKVWWKEYGDSLFFTESGGYRWYIDPLAYQRKKPTAELRGEKRADR